MSELPQGWITSEVEGIFQSFGGGTPNRATPAYWRGNIPWLSSGDIKSDHIQSASETITRSGLEHSSASLCPPGSVLVVVRSGILKHRLPVAVLRVEAAINQDIKCFDSGCDKLNEWLALAFRASERDILALNREGTTVQSVKYETLKSFELPIPPLPEQRRIVAKLEKLLAKVDACRNRLDKIPVLLKRFRQSVLAAACSGRLTEDWREKHTDQDTGSLVVFLTAERERMWKQRRLGKLGCASGAIKAESKRMQYRPPFTPAGGVSDVFPPTWAPVTVSQVAFLDVGFAFKSADFVDNGIKLLRGENIEPGKLRWSETRYWPRDKVSGLESPMVKEGEVILALDRPLISSGLKIARATRADIPCLLVQRVMRFRMVEPRVVNWLYYNLNLGDFIRHLSSGMTGSDLPHVTGTGVAEYTFGLPPLDEQQEIVRRVEALFALADQIEARYNKAKACVDKLTQSVLAKAFRGELVPQDPNDEPAEELLKRIREERTAENKNTGPKPRRETKHPANRTSRKQTHKPKQR